MGRTTWSKRTTRMSGEHEEEEELDLGLDSVFPEEERPASPPPDVKYYTRPNGQSVSIQLVNKHPLWGQVLYPTSICLSDFLAERANQYIKGKNVLELGAGGGLPGVVSALEGAAKSVVTDFPDPSLISNLERNARENVPSDIKDRIIVEGYTWGSRTQPLLKLLDGGTSYDTVLAADLVFNHSQHLALLKTCEECLAGSEVPILLCFYSHHRPTPELIAKDEGFVKLAEERGWTSERVMRNTQAGPAFPADAGDLAIRSTVHGWKLVPPPSER